MKDDDDGYESAASLIETETAIARDERRPTFERVLEVIRTHFKEAALGVDEVESHEGFCMWVDRDSARNRLPKYYVLSTSTAEETFGYPLLTIRQAYSTVLDTWITLSGIVMGPGEGQISRSVIMLVANHLGLFAGMRYVTTAIVHAEGSPIAGVRAANELLEAASEVSRKVAAGKTARELAEEIREERLEKQGLN